MIDIKESQPVCKRIVWCFRNYSGEKEIRLARRNANSPYISNPDPTDCCIWEGLNEHEGKRWADITVEGWKEL